jgi:uncharacterized membrane protein YedE/YeeE
MFERIMTMFTTVANEPHGPVWLVFVIGILFGGIIQYSRVDKFEKIAGFAMLRDTVVPKMLFLAIGLASIGLYFIIEMGWAHYHIKPIILGGLIIGGILFGVSMAIFGKCPGTGPVSVAEGRIDVLVGSIGGIFGGLLFSVYYEPFFKHIMGPDLGKINLTGIVGDHGALTVLIFGIALVVISILIPLRQEFDEADLKQLEE